MNKKLFVVLVVISAILASFSVAFGATKLGEADVQYIPRPVSTPPQLEAIKIQATRAHGTQGSPLGTITEIRFQPLLPNWCDLTLVPGPFTPFIAWNWGGEIYAVYQAPEILGPPCNTGTYPFEVRQVDIVLDVLAGAPPTIDLQPMILSNGGTVGCPSPGNLLGQGAIYTIPLPGPATYLIALPCTVCVYYPYFAAVNVITGGLAGVVEVVTTTVPPGPVPCYSYDNWGSGFADLSGYGMPGYLALWSAGYDAGQNTCPPPPPPPACNVQIDGGPFWRAGFFEPEGIVNYFDPAALCGTPTYPFGVDSVLFRLTTAGVAYPIDLKIAFFDLQPGTGGDSCDGPGREIYSQIVSLPTGGYHSIALTHTVCFYRPFFGGYFMASSAVGDTFWPNFSEETEDTCRSWYFDGGNWWNWAQTWGFPSLGHVVFRPRGYTQHASCPVNGGCEYLTSCWPWGTGSYYSFTHPNVVRPYLASKFTAPAAAQLGHVRARFRWRNGTPDVWFYLWHSDGKYPSTLVDSIFYKTMGAADSSLWVWRSVDFTSKNIYLADGERFHIGIGVPNFVSPTTNRIYMTADSGFKTTDNSEYYWTYTRFGPGGYWGTSPFWMSFNDMREYFFTYEQTGTEWNIEAELCYAQVDFKLTVDPPGPACFAYACQQAVAGGASATYNVHVDPLAGYASTVSLSASGLPAGVTAAFVPASGIPPFTSVLTVTAGASVPYGTYTLTISASGAKGLSNRDVTVQVIPNVAYEENLVEAAHCSTRVTNFGAIANANEGLNFFWDNFNGLFDGGYILATDENHIALNYGRTHGVNKWFYGPSIFPETLLSVVYYSEYGQLAEARWVDALGMGVKAKEYVIGIMTPEGGGDFSIHALDITNEGPPNTFYFGIFCDWDIYDNSFNRGGYDSLHNMEWIYDMTASSRDSIWGHMRIPLDNNLCPGYRVFKQQSTTWHYSGSGFGNPDLWHWLASEQWDTTYYAGNDTDWSSLFTVSKFTLGTGASRHEAVIEFAKKNSEPNKAWWHRALRYAGFYRGDVNSSDSLETEFPALDISDLVYMQNYLFLGGTAPVPYADQGDVNGDGKVNIADCVYLVNYAFVNGPPPVDYMRFIPEMWSRPSLFASPIWK